MNNQTTKRSYSMARREVIAANSRTRILDVTAELWKHHPINEITLEKVATESGVTMRTILRKFGTKEELLEACIEHGAKNVIRQRDSAPAGNLREALRILMDEYEIMGDAVYRAITQQEELPVAKNLLRAGRTTHRLWCERVFSPFLPDKSSGDYEIRLLAYISASEVYLWKLLRRDLGLSYDDTFQVYLTMLESLEKINK